MKPQCNLCKNRIEGQPTYYCTRLFCQECYKTLTFLNKPPVGISKSSLKRRDKKQLNKEVKNGQQ